MSQTQIFEDIEVEGIELEDEFLEFILNDDNANPTQFASYSENEINEMNESTIPKNTVNRNRWAYSLF